MESLKFTRIQLLIECNGTDEVHLTIDGPTPFPNMDYEGSAKILVQKGYGLEWVRKTFGRDPDETVSLKTGRKV